MEELRQPEKESAAQTCTPNFDTSNPLQQEVSRILNSFQMDLMGVISLGKDGVLRSLTADRTVLSAQGLSPELIEAFLDRLPEAFRPPSDEHADGTKTPKEKWFSPDSGVLPEPLAQEHIDQYKNSSIEEKERMRKRMRNDKNIVDVSGVAKEDAAPL